MKVKTKSKKVDKAWFSAHINDPYVKLAQKNGYRSRAVYKLTELDETFHLIKPFDSVVDLGCAPGAWSQYVSQRLTLATSDPSLANSDERQDALETGHIVGLDLLPMQPIHGVEFIQGDFSEPEVWQKLNSTPALKNRKVDLVLSDMAPNLSGHSSTDTARVEHLLELVLEFCQQHLKAGGHLVAKVFHSGAYQAIHQRFESQFTKVRAVKPRASRPNSAETFLVGLSLKK